MKQVQKLKIELAAAVVSLMIAALCLTSATYAWYAANKKVLGTTSFIKATTNGFILQIATAANGVDHGGAAESLAAQTNGGQISPSSTDDIVNWYTFSGWDEHGDVNSYSQISFYSGRDAKPGQIDSEGKYFAYIMSDYVLYTIADTGYADVYLVDDGITPAIQITRTSGNTSERTLPDSVRIGIVSYDLETMEETLRLVYAPTNETGKGNDTAGLDGWTCVRNGALQGVTYPYVYGQHYIDSHGNNRAAIQTPDGKDFTIAAGAVPVIPNVGYNGVGFRVYIWLEGTDEQCVNNPDEEDVSSFDVTVRLAGVAQ